MSADISVHLFDRHDASGEARRVVSDHSTYAKIALALGSTTITVYPEGKTVGELAAVFTKIGADLAVMAADPEVA
jgi:hypothetical protein